MFWIKMDQGIPIRRTFSNNTQKGLSLNNGDLCHEDGVHEIQRKESWSQHNVKPPIAGYGEIPGRLFMVDVCRINHPSFIYRGVSWGSGWQARGTIGYIHPVLQEPKRA